MPSLTSNLGAAHHRFAAPLRLSVSGNWAGAWHASNATVCGRWINGMTDRPAAAEGSSRARPARLGLSGKLLVLTLLFVMIAEVLIYVPSIANFRLNWLHDRLSAAYTAALVFEAAPEGMVPEPVARQILDSIGARAVAMKMGQQRRLLAVSDMPPAINHDIDMRDMSWHRAIIDAFDTLLCADDDVMRVVGPAPMGGEFVEIVLDEAPLRKAMVEFSVRISDPVADHLRHHRDAGLSRAALPAGAADAADDRQHGRVPRRPGESRPHHRGLRPHRRDRHRRARARRHAARPRHAAAAEEPSRRARARGVEDQSRPAQPAVLGAAVLRAAGEDLRSARAALRAQAHARARARHRVLPIDACPTAACRSRRPTAARWRSSRWSRTCARRSGSIPARRCAGSARSSAA